MRKGSLVCVCVCVCMSVLEWAHAAWSRSEPERACRAHNLPDKTSTHAVTKEPHQALETTHTHTKHILYEYIPDARIVLGDFVSMFL